MSVPTLVISGADDRHPTALAAEAARTLPRSRLADASLNSALRTAEDLAAAVAPEVGSFLTTHIAAGSGRVAGDPGGADTL